MFAVFLSFEILSGSAVHNKHSVRHKRIDFKCIIDRAYTFRTVESMGFYTVLGQKSVVRNNCICQVASQLKINRNV